MRNKYLDIIKKAKLENRKKGLGIYYELHHILPKSLFPLWTKRKSNLILLTAKEHIICHQLLSKIYGGKMWSAYWRLATDKKDGHELTPEEYENLKLNYSKFCSERNKELFKNPEERKKRGLPGKLNGNFGNYWTKEQKKNLSEKVKGKPKPHSIEWETKRISAIRKYFELNKGNIVRKKQKQRIRKIINLNTKEIFMSIREASKKYSGSINRAIKTRGTANNMFWSEYYNNINISEELKIRQQELKLKLDNRSKKISLGLLRKNK